jgi:ATP-dependent Lon protease
VVSQFQQIVTSSPTLSDDLQTIAINIDEPGRLADFIASSLPFLTTTTSRSCWRRRMSRRGWSGSTSTWRRSWRCSSCATRSRPRCRIRCSQSQRDYYLREQLKAIQKELGDLDDTQKDIAELKEKIEARACRRRPRRTR